MSGVRDSARAEILESDARRGIERRPVDLERKADAWAMIDASGAFTSWCAGVDLRRWSRHPEVTDAIREARAATAKAARLALEVVWNAEGRS